MKTLKQIENCFKNEIEKLKDMFDDVYLTGSQYQIIQIIIKRIKALFLDEQLQLFQIFDTDELKRYYDSLKFHLNKLTLSDDKYTEINNQIEIVGKYLKGF